MAKNTTFNLSIRLLTQQFQKGLNTVQKQLRTFGNYIKSVFAVTGITSFIRQLTNVGGEFENQMARVRAVANATDAEYKMLEDTAKRIGKNTRYSAMEAAQGLEILTRNGLSAAEAADVLTPALDLAAANAIGLAEAGDMVTNTLNMFNKPTSEAASVADILSAACANSATDVTNLYEAFKNAGPTASSLGLSIEETSAALMTLANQGIKGSDAGSKLAQAFSKFNVPKVQEKLKDLGIEINSDTLKMNGLRDAILKLRDAELTPEQMVELFGERAWRGVNTLVKEFESLEENIDIAGRASGTSSRMAEQGIGSWAEATKKLHNTWTSSMNKMFEAMKPILIGVVNMVRGIIQWITSLPGVIAAALSIISVTVIKAIGKVKTAQDNARNSTRVLTEAYQILNKAVANNNFAEARVELQKLIMTEAEAGRSTTQLTNALNSLKRAEAQGAQRGAVTALTLDSIKRQSDKMSTSAAIATASLGKTGVAAGVFTKALNGLKLAGKSVLQFFGGWVGLAITVATVIGSVLVNAIKKSKEAMVDYEKIHSEAIKNAGEERAKIDSLIRIIHDENQSYAVKARAVEELRRIIPKYSADIDKNGKFIKDNKKAVDDYCDSLVEEAEMQILAGQAAQQRMLLEEATARYLKELETDQGPNFWDKMVQLITGATFGVQDMITAEQSHQSKLDKKKQVVDALQRSYDGLIDKMTELKKKQDERSSNKGGNSGGGDAGDDDDERTKAAKKYQKAIENLDAVRKKSEEEYKKAIEDGLSEQEARARELLTEEEYLKKLISACEAYIDTLSDLDDLNENDLEIIKKINAELAIHKKRYEAIKEAKDEAKKAEEDYAKSLERLNEAVDNVNDTEDEHSKKPSGKTEIDFYSTETREYTDLVNELTKAEEDLAAAKEKLAKFSKKDIEALEKRINTLRDEQKQRKLTAEEEQELANGDKILKHYDLLQNSVKMLSADISDLNTKILHLDAEKAMKNLNRTRFDEAYGGVKTLISGIEQFKSAIDKIGEGSADFFDYISLLTCTIDTVMSLIDTVNTMQQIMQQLSNAEKIYNETKIEGDSKIIASEVSKATAIETSEATIASAVTAAELEKTAAVVAGCETRAAAYQTEMAAAAAAANAWAGIYGVALAAAEIAGMEALIAAASIPKFASGGILGGSSRTGDKLLFRGNSGEVILNDRQQKNLLDIANGKGKSGNSGQVEFFISGKNLKGVLNNINSSSSKIKGNL